MAPARIKDDDPIAAEFDVYLTPAHQEQLYLLQYPSRDMNRPYSRRTGGMPDVVRLKPQTGQMEMDLTLSSSDSKFNKYQSLKWGDGLSTARMLQESSTTYGLAGGFAAHGHKQRGPAGPAARVQIKDRADREEQILEDLTHFSGAESAGAPVMKTQTMGGQIVRSVDESAQEKPVSFLGAFQGRELHLTQVDGTVQMRTQLHHVDAELHREHVQASRAAAAAAVAAAEDGTAAPVRPQQAKGLGQTFASEQDVKPSPEELARKMLRQIEEENWTKLGYVDEDADEAYETFHKCMFVENGPERLVLGSTLEDEQYLDAISASRLDLGGKRKKRPPKKGDVVDVDTLIRN